MSRRRRSGNKWFHNHALPFLSIMLGLIAVMALTGMGLATIKRSDESTRQFVKLASVPPELIPFHIVCEKNRVLWRKNGKWKTVNLVFSDSSIGDEATIEFVRKLALLAETNRFLSFKGKQNTLILWVRPDGVGTSSIVEAHAAKLPLRVGKLPLLENEDVTRDGVGL